MLLSAGDGERAFRPAPGALRASSLGLALDGGLGGGGGDGRSTTHRITSFETKNGTRTRSGGATHFAIRDLTVWMEGGRVAEMAVHCSEPRVEEEVVELSNDLVCHLVDRVAE